MMGLYIHVPFCEQKCPYCDFFSLKYNNSDAYSYAEAVCRNVDFYNERYDTVYFGGGTPSLAVNEICKIMTSVRCSDDAEITIEANPGTVTIQGLSMLKDCGINRLSFGVQSFSNSELFKLGRKHSSETAHSAISLAANIGFTNISVDLMLGIPSQTPDSVRRNVKILSKMPVTHISAYMLKIEPNTPIAFSNMILPSEEETALIYSSAVNALSDAGFIQYEVSNFAKPGYECKHNLKYWRSEDYLGIGPAAHSCYNGDRFAVPSDLKLFINSQTQPVYLTDSNPCTFGEFAMLKLRLSEGLLFDEMTRFGIDENAVLKNVEYIPSNYINVTDKGINITKDGFLLSNQIIGRLLNGIGF